MGFDSLKVSTYNILYPYKQNNFDFLPDQGKELVKRIPGIVFNILEVKPDLFCLQEISQDTFKELQHLLVGYRGYHANHDGNVPGGTKPDGVAVFYLEKKFNVKAIKTCTKTQRTTTARRDLYIDVEDKVTQRVIRCAAVHFEGYAADKPEGSPERYKGDQQVREVIQYVTAAHPQQDYSLDGIAIGCDLNQVGDQQRSKIFADAGFKTTQTSADNESEIKKNRQIDWIFFNSLQSNLTLNPSCEIEMSFPSASDHRLVSAYIQTTPVFHKNQALKVQKESSFSLQSSPLPPAQPSQPQAAPVPVLQQTPSMLTPNPAPILQQMLSSPNSVPSPVLQQTSCTPPIQASVIQQKNTAHPSVQQNPVSKQTKTQWTRFSEKMSHIFSVNKKWLLPLSLVSFGLVPVAITIYQLFYYLVLRQKG